MTEPASPPIATIDHQGRRYVVTCRIGFDGVEYIGRLWFGPQDGSELPMPDRSAIPGRSRDEVLTFAQRFSPQELMVRHRRAMAEKRRYLSLRRATDEIIAKVIGHADESFTRRVYIHTKDSPRFDAIDGDDFAIGAD